MLLPRICILAFAAAVAAQFGLLDCAKGCVKTLPQNCKTGEFECICSSQGWITDISCCVSKSCSAADQTLTIEKAVDLCKIVGVTLPQAASCSESESSSIASSSPSTASSSLSAAPVPAGSITSGVKSSLSAKATTAGSVASQSSLTQSATAAQSTAAQSTAAAASATPGAAAPVTGPGIAFAGVAVAALALL